MAISLDPSGDEFVLTDAQGSSVRLSENDVLTLAESAEGLRAHILAKHSRAGVYPASVVPVAHLELNADVHHTEMHMTMVQPSGAKSQTFGIPASVVRHLLADLPKWLAQLDAPKTTN